LAPQNKIINHPCRDEITRKLTSGESVRDISAWLADKYPATTQRHLRISPSSIQQFKRDHLNLTGQVLKDIKDASRQTKAIIKEEVTKDMVRQSTAYQEAIQAIAEEKLDVQRELVEVVHILKAKIEYFYNKLEMQDFSEKQEKAFQKYLDQMMHSLEAYKKYVEGHTETTEHNINVNIVTDQVGLIRESVREILLDMEPDMAVSFMGKLNGKMRNLSYNSEMHSQLYDDGITNV